MCSSCFNIGADDSSDSAAMQFSNLVYSNMLVEVLNIGREEMRNKLLALGPDAPQFFIDRALGWADALNYIQIVMLGGRAPSD